MPQNKEKGFKKTVNFSMFDADYELVYKGRKKKKLRKKYKSILLLEKCNATSPEGNAQYRLQRQENSY